MRASKRRVVCMLFDKVYVPVLLVLLSVEVVRMEFEGFEERFVFHEDYGARNRKKEHLVEIHGDGVT